jgi:hypothetical protein
MTTLRTTASLKTDPGGNAVVISIQGDHFVPVPFERMLDPSADSQAGQRRGPVTASFMAPGARESAEKINPVREAPPSLFADAPHSPQFEPAAA